MRVLTVSEQCNTRLENDYIELLQGAEHCGRWMPGRSEEDAFCFSIDGKQDSYSVQSSYFVGVDWVNSDLAIQVLPKVKTRAASIDYLKMLVEALQEPENSRNLDGLITVDFFAKPIKLEQKEDILSPFIIAQFVMTLKNAARKGLRKSYYMVTENLHSKVKGKILVEQNIRQNISRRNIVDNVCRHQEYGVNNEENKILKKALGMASKILSSYHGQMKIDELKRTIAGLKPFFREVGDDYDIENVNAYNANPIFKDYYSALKYAILIIKRCSYGVGKNADKLETTPPYWIDMSKLFELYVLKRLREVYSAGEIAYQKNISGRYPDYLLRPNDESEPYVIDAKYKLAYNDGYQIDDVRQVSAYARMKGVYKHLGVEDRSKLLRCLIVYPSLTAQDHFIGRFDTDMLEASTTYEELYKIGINLPLQQ